MSLSPPPGAAPPHRFPALDALRGVAIALMLAFHLAFDLDHFGIVRVDMFSPFWVNFRTGIVMLFLLVMGISLHLATRDGIRWPRYGRRLAQIVLYALLVSIGTWFVFPDSWIYFGVLHFIAVASVLGLAFRRLYWSNLLLGVGIWVLHHSWDGHAWFNPDWWNWSGLNAELPNTEDYVPLIPWFGTVLVGLFLGKWLFDRPAPIGLPAALGNTLPVRALALAGRHSLNIYILHQPLLFGLLWLIAGR